MFLFILMTLLAISAAVLIHLGASQAFMTLWERSQSLRRWRIAILVVLFIAVHIIEIGVFSLAIYTLLENGSYGALNGIDTYNFRNMYYYSAVTYTTVGYGDITPIGDMRLFAAVEALTGMVLVAWTASVIFTVMLRTWQSQQGVSVAENRRGA